MKKRLLSFLLALALVLAMIPVGLNITAHAETGTAEMPDYSISSGLGNLQTSGGVTTLQRSGPMLKGIIDPNEETTFNYYLFLYDRSTWTYAPAEHYAAYWKTYDSVTVDLSGDADNVTLSEVKTTEDGYKYVTVTVTGPCSGSISFTITDTETGTSKSGYEMFEIAQAKQLTLDENGVAAFSESPVNIWERFWYYVDLGAAKAATVSGQLDGDTALGWLYMTSPSERTLWYRDSEGSAPTTYAVNISDRYVVFFAYTYAAADTFSGSITVEAEQPRLLYRNPSWSETEPAYSLQDLRLTPGSNGASSIYLYYGTTESSVPLTGGTFTSDKPDVITAGVSDDGTYYIEAKSFGTATLTYSDGTNTYTAEMTVSLPYWDAFYSERDRSEDTYLSTAEYDPKNGMTLWVMNESGYTAAETEGWTVTLNGNAVAGATAERVLRPGSADRYDMKITLPVGLTPGRWGWLRASNGRQGREIRLTEKEYPRLLYRQVGWDNHAAYESEDNWLQDVSLTLTPGGWLQGYFYYGTTTEHLRIHDLSVVSGDSVSIRKYTDRDGKAYWDLQAVKIGGTVIQADDHTITFSVDLPVHGLYTAQSRDSDHLCPSSGDGVSYYSLQEKVLWLMCEEGYTAEELDAFTVTVDGQSAVTEPFLRDGGTDRFDLKIRLVEPATMDSYINYSVIVRHSQQGQVAYGFVCNQLRGNYATVGDYVVGFVWSSYGWDGIIQMIRPDQTGYGQATGFLPSEGNPFAPSREDSFMIMAGEPKTDAQGAVYYDPVPENKLSFRVKRTWFEVVNGEEGTLSWTESAPTSTEKSDYPAGTTQLTIYNKEGYTLNALVFAELEVTVGKEVRTVTISAPYEVWQEITSPSVVRPADDTAEKLNAYLAELANQDLSGVNGIDIYLADTTYEGIIEFPSQRLWVRFHGGSCTTIKGGISLNGAYFPTVDGIHFIAPESDELTRAIWGGPSNLTNCTFYGYDVALDSTNTGLVSPAQNNVFVNNKIAVRVNINGYSTGKVDTNWWNNTFIGNDTAIQILSLDVRVSSYYLRITYSNFVGNTVDFDVQEDGTLYMYNNYFGKIHPKAEKMDIGNFLAALYAARSEKAQQDLITSNSPNVTIAKGVKAKVVTNPRLKYFNHWGYELACGDVGHIIGAEVAPAAPDTGTPTGFCLISDWGDTVTQIVNGEAGDLVLDPSAFDAEGDKNIIVVNGEEEIVVGTWTFD